MLYILSRPGHPRTPEARWPSLSLVLAKKMGENPTMPYPQCARSINTDARGNNDAPSISQYGSLVRPHAQIVTPHAHCNQCAPLKLVLGICKCLERGDLFREELGSMLRKKIASTKMADVLGVTCSLENPENKSRPSMAV